MKVISTRVETVRVQLQNFWDYNYIIYNNLYTIYNNYNCDVIIIIIIIYTIITTDETLHYAERTQTNERKFVESCENNTKPFNI